MSNWYSDAEWLPVPPLAAQGKVLVIAPHQDDESLGCGGTIALLKKAGAAVHVAFVTDGSMSHPHSKKYPAQKLVALREAESVAALKVLGVPAGDITFLRLQDSRLPATNQAGFEDAVELANVLLSTVQPATVFVPWQRDPHPDHRATWQIVNAALQNFNKPIRKLEYLIWLWERAGANDFPKPGEVKVWQADIRSVVIEKQQAIAAHVSQTTRLIDDDPHGFMLSAEVLAHFNTLNEIFVEEN